MKSTFFWKSSSVRSSPAPNKKDTEGEPKKKSIKLATKASPSNHGCNEEIDHTVYKVLTKRIRKGPKSTPRVACSVDGWRGPREEPSEVPVGKKGMVRGCSMAFKVFS